MKAVPETQARRQTVTIDLGPETLKELDAAVRVISAFGHDERFLREIPLYGVITRSAVVRAALFAFFREIGITVNGKPNPWSHTTSPATSPAVKAKSRRRSR